MKKILFIWFLLLASAVRADTTADLSFSLDQGKTWEIDFPILKIQRQFMVRVDFTVTESREFTNNPVITVKLGSDQDFASANRGCHRWSQNQRLYYYQIPDKNYRNVRQPGFFIINVDLGERPDNIMGVRNLWAQESKKYVDAILPELSAYQAGSYRFVVSLTYVIKDDTGKHIPVETLLPFQLLVAE